MAASDSQLAAGRSFASDLREIRKKHGVDRKAVLDATRLADDVIEQLEENALVNHPAFNHVYLRSLLRVYGEAIGIDREDILTALDAVFDGSYAGSLAQVYLGHTPEAVVSEVDPSQSAVEEYGGEGKSSSETEDPRANGADSHTNEDTHVAEAPGSEDSADGREATGGAESIPASGINEDAHRLREPEVEAPRTASKAQSDLWERLFGGKTFLLPNLSGTSMAVVVGVSFIVLVWLAVTTLRSLSVNDTTLVVSPDSTFQEAVVLPPRVILPDSILGAIIAADEPLDPIRITVDRDLRKPYWVEYQDTHRVAFRERLVLEREADHTRVLIDGYVLPQQWLGEAGPVVITRTRVQAWLDSLVAEGVAPQRDVPFSPTGIERP